MTDIRTLLLYILIVFVIFCSEVKNEDARLSPAASDKGLFSFITNRFTTVKPQDVRVKHCSCSCGVKNDESRIVGGQETEVNEYPWAARLTYFNRFYCGATLINDLYVLTAAHCVKGLIWFLIKVTFGEHDRCNSTLKPESRFVIRAFTREFSYANFDHDVAVLRLNDRIPITENIRPVCLPKDTNIYYEGHKAYATGWGTLREGGKPSCVLQEVELPVMTNEECRANSSYRPGMVSDNMLCAGYYEGKKDTCQGDSGGPLVVERKDKKFEQIGIVSWGNGCARPSYPGVYTRVTKYLDWIMENVKDGCFCEDD